MFKEKYLIIFTVPDKNKPKSDLKKLTTKANKLSAPASQGQGLIYTQVVQFGNFREVLRHDRPFAKSAPFSLEKTVSHFKFVSRHFTSLQ